VDKIIRPNNTRIYLAMCVLPAEVVA